MQSSTSSSSDFSNDSQPTSQLRESLQGAVSRERQPSEQANETALTPSFLKDSAMTALNHYATQGWATRVWVEGQPKPFTTEAMEALINQAKVHFFALIRKSLGVAYLRGNSVVDTEDALIAVEVEATGVDAVQPSPRWA